MILPIHDNPGLARARECKGLAEFHRRRAEEPTLFDFAPIPQGTTEVEKALRKAIEAHGTGKWKRFMVAIKPCEHDQEEATVETEAGPFYCNWIDTDEDTGELLYEVDRNGKPDEQEAA